MNLLFTLFTVMNLHNPFVTTLPAFPDFYTPPQISVQSAPKSIHYVGASVSVSGKTFGGFRLEQQPTTVYSKDNPPPQGWDASNVPGIGVTCQATTQCLDELYGLSNDGGQPGYLAVCPDGAEAQGSCETPGGVK